MAGKMLDGIVAARQRFEALAEVCDVALCRSFAALEGMGYSPDLLPPSSPVN